MTPSHPAVLGGQRSFTEPLPLVRPTLTDLPGLTDRLQSILESGILTNNKTVRELEEVVADRCEVTHVIATSSCTSGLMLVLQALGAAGRVVMPSFTFAASAHAVAWAGGTPVFADVDRRSLTLDPEDAARLTDGATAMTATHIYGNPCDVDALESVAAEANIPLVYDAAHALGSRRSDRPIGGFGSAEVFSMSPTKVAVAGEGGLVATNDAGLAEAVRLGRDYGNPGDYDCRFIGLNARMSELHAAVGLASLSRLDANIARRNELVTEFRRLTAGVPGLDYPVVRAEDVCSYKDLTLIVDQDEFGLSAPQLTSALAAEGIDSRRYYYPPIHRQKAYSYLPEPRSLPVTDDMCERVLTPPLFSHMTDTHIGLMARTVVALHERAASVRQALDSI